MIPNPSISRKITKYTVNAADLFTDSLIKDQTPGQSMAKNAGKYH